MANPIKLKCIVSSIINHDDAVSTITMTPSRRLPNFKPGQFLHLALDPFDPTVGFWPESRVFSIASMPLDPDITIAYGVKGAFTKRMREELAVGKEVWIRLPYGHFGLAASPDEEIILVAGGTGITPFSAFILNELWRSSGMVLKLVYGVKKPDLFLFTDMLIEAMSRLSGFKLFAFSEEIYDNKMLFSINKGSLSFDKIWEAANDPASATFYLSGPVNMINSLKAGLKEKGINPEKIKIDEWE
ncbi:MAG: FAD-dependent oxidoreductase [Deltaproteobacteria bacterium]|nr:FAD-dependent oxidoreductase [Deltaproteobacteria bacterium]